MVACLQNEIIDEREIEKHYLSLKNSTQNETFNRYVSKSNMQFPSFYILTQLCHLVYVSFHMVFLRFYITVTRKLCSNQLEALHFIGFNKSVCRLQSSEVTKVPSQNEFYSIDNAILYHGLALYEAKEHF